MSDSPTNDAEAEVMAAPEDDDDEGNPLSMLSVSVELTEDDQADGDSTAITAEQEDASQYEGDGFDESYQYDMSYDGTFGDESATSSSQLDCGEVDNSVVYDASMFYSDDPVEQQKTYLENFLYSEGEFKESTNENENSNDADDSKSYSPLARFTKIAKAVQCAEYETLQNLYQLLYQRSAWDTQQILIRRILEFKGFGFSEKSEEYYNRELMLKTLPYEKVLKIGAILQLDQVRLCLSNRETGWPKLIEGIMAFLLAPAKKTQTRSVGRPSLSLKLTDGAASIQTCGCRNNCLKRFKESQRRKLLDYVKQIEAKKLLTSYLISLMQMKKVERAQVAPSIPPDNRRNRDVLYIYTVKYGSNEVMVCKSAFCILHGISVGKTVSLQNKLKSGKKPPKIKPGSMPPFEDDDPLTEVVKTPKQSPIKKGSPNSKLVSVVKIDEQTNSSAGKKTVSSSGSAKNDKEEDKTSKDKPKKDKMKLREFPLVLKAIEDSPKELLIDVHYVLFLGSAEDNELKNSILEFDGFKFEQDTEDYDDRSEFLQRMSFKMVSDVARAFSLAVLSTKEETIKNILSFLAYPDESYLRSTVSMPPSLSDVEIDDIAEMSDSDDSITCEVVEKKVECIDILSSGEDEDIQDVTKREKKKNSNKQPQVNKNPPNVVQNPPRNAITAVLTLPQQVIAPQIVVAAPQSQLVSTTPTAVTSTGDRCLGNFETICKIVNTHPPEYLVDIYDLLYLQKHEPSTLRKDILSFTGFSFEKGSQDYVKRKQLLDRMLYNSVRRIYNTLIHNTTEVKVFSKPTMIAEIFQFLFKLPDHDTSVRPNTSAAKPVAKPMAVAMPTIKANPVTPPNLPPSAPGRLSDLKRVFQRVACFPCEYLIDVHKLLFMSDCDPKDIRKNIFDFKGFDFDVSSDSFQQRKMYLEYLAFHSLRKISSVLTTRAVDLRNSTKHELASHLTQVLAEYCNMTVEDTNQVYNPDIPMVTPPTAPETSSEVENIVVTPIIDPSSISDPSNKSVLPIITSTASMVSTNPPQTKVTKPAAGSNSNSNKSSTPANSRKRKTDDPKPAASNQFVDISLPEVEQYQKLYSQNIVCPPGVLLVPQTAANYTLVPSNLPIVQVHSTPQIITPAATSALHSEMILPGDCVEANLEETPAKKKKTIAKTTKKAAVAKESPAPTEKLSRSKMKETVVPDDDDDEDCDTPLASLIGHPTDSVLVKHIEDIIGSTNLQDITINGVIQKVFKMYPKFDLSYKKEFMKSTLRTMLYRLGEVKAQQTHINKPDSPICPVTTTEIGDADSNQ